MYDEESETSTKTCTHRHSYHTIVTETSFLHDENRLAARPEYDQDEPIKSNRRKDELLEGLRLFHLVTNKCNTLGRGT